MAEIAINKTRWMQLADELFPGESVDSPSELYMALAKSVVIDSVRVDLDSTLELSSDDVFAAEEAVWGTLAYSLAYRSQITDGAEGTQQRLEALATQYMSIMNEKKEG